MLFQYETMKNKIYIMLNKVFRHANMFVCSTRHGIDQASAAHHMIHTTLHLTSVHFVYILCGIVT